MKTNYVWVIEIADKGEKNWLPTFGVKFNRDDGRKGLKMWKDNMHESNFKFRLKKYIAGGHR